jgi:hypothetical protein
MIFSKVTDHIGKELEYVGAQVHYRVPERWLLRFGPVKCLVFIKNVDNILDFIQTLEENVVLIGGINRKLSEYQYPLYVFAT